MSQAKAIQRRSMYAICPSYSPENNSIQLTKELNWASTLKFSSQFRGFSPPKIILHRFLADLKVHIYENETTNNGKANVTNVKEKP